MPENLPQPGRYDFGLSEDQEAAAARIHREAIVVDMLSQQAGANIFDHYPPALCEEFDRTIAEAGHFYEKFLRGVMWPYEMSRRGDSDLIADWFREAGLTVIAHGVRSEEQTSELQSLMRISYAVFCLKQKKNKQL